MALEVELYQGTLRTLLARDVRECKGNVLEHLVRVRVRSRGRGRGRGRRRSRSRGQP